MILAVQLAVASSLGPWIRANVPGGEWGALIIFALVVPTLLSFVLIRGSDEERQEASRRNVAMARAEGLPQPWRAAGYSRTGMIMALFILIVLVGSFMVK